MAWQANRESHGSRHDGSFGDLGHWEILGPPAAEVPFFDLTSTDPLPPIPDAPQGLPPPARDDEPRGRIWLDGDALLCSCPDCGAPMSIRLWLLIADCWSCGASIELSEELHREALRVLGEQRRAERRSSGSSAQDLRPTRPVAADRRAVDQPDSASRTRTTGRAGPPRPPTRSPDVSAARRAAPRDAGEVPRRPAAARPRGRGWLNRFLKQTPAWLVSLLFHLFLLTLLGLLKVAESDGPYIRLASAVSRVVQPGGHKISLDPRKELAFDLPVPDDIDWEDERQREAMVRADHDARLLRIDPDAADPQLPDLDYVKRQISDRPRAGQALAARDPRVRVEMVRREGGTTLTEAAVSRSLRWLARHQSSAGNWSLHAFHRAAGCTCGGRGAVESDSAATSLALLPYLGAGQTHLTGRYQDAVAGGLRWMIERQQANGDLRHRSARNAGMYAQGQGALVLCEAFWMTGDEELRIPAQRAIDFIVEAQHYEGGWRYTPGAPGDTSVLGWQLMALQSARGAGLTVPEETFENAARYLDTVQHQSGALYSYMQGQQPTHVMTAEALLCRIYLGWTKSNSPLLDGVNLLTRRYLPSRRDTNIYYWYYAAQAVHHVGGAQWDQWNLRMRDVLVASQETRGHEAGSWAPRGPYADAGGRIYMTALAACSLEVYYRHLPLFRRIDLD